VDSRKQTCSLYVLTALQTTREDVVAVADVVVVQNCTGKKLAIKTRKGNDIYSIFHVYRLLYP
jgi:hypothetical protein